MFLFLCLNSIFLLFSLIGYVGYVMFMILVGVRLLCVVFIFEELCLFLCWLWERPLGLTLFRIFTNGTVLCFVLYFVWYVL